MKPEKIDASKEPPFKLGAMLGPVPDWRRDKTPASIKFVEEAEECLGKGGLEPKVHVTLSNFTRAVKTGKIILTEDIPLEQLVEK